MNVIDIRAPVAFDGTTTPPLAADSTVGVSPRDRAAGGIQGGAAMNRHEGFISKPDILSTWRRFGIEFAPAAARK